MAQQRRTLHDIKTLASGVGTPVASSSVYSVYLKIAMLEAERERRAKEHATAMARAECCAERMRQIDEEVRSLRDTIAEAEREKPAPRPSPEQPRSSADKRGRTFRF